MKSKPTIQEVQLLLKRLAEGPTRSETPSRTQFAISAIRLVVNEGICAAETAALHIRAFNAKDRWVEFLPQNAESLVRRRLSDDTAHHLTELIQRRSAQPDDPICQYTPKIRANRRSAGFTWSGAVKEEAKLAGFDPERFSMRVLKWIWADANPDLAEQEQTTAMLARFVRLWAYPYQQEALFQRIYQKSPVLRPSWAYPRWHKNRAETAAHPSEPGHPSQND